MTRFSIVIPTRNRDLRIPLNSLAAQTFRDFEVIIVDDCSNEGYFLESFNLPSLKFTRLSKHSERVIAWKTGLRQAKGEWLARLDSDDAYAAHYLGTVNKAIEEHPDAKCFNFGAVVHRGYNTTLRPAFKPRWLGDRHEEFKSGQIGAGSFVFHQDALEEVLKMPDASNPYKFHELATFVHHLYPYPGQTLGNPFGDDFAAFFLLTRKYRSIPLDNCLYVQYVRGSIG